MPTLANSRADAARCRESDHSHLGERGSNRRDVVGATHESGHLRGEVVRHHRHRPLGWEPVAKFGMHQLEEAHWFGEVPESMEAEVEKIKGAPRASYAGPRALGDDDLTTVGCGRDPRRLVDGQTEVVTLFDPGRARVETIRTRSSRSSGHDCD